MSERSYLRPLPIGDPEILRLLPPVADRANGAIDPKRPLPLAGGPLAFVSTEVLTRGPAGTSRTVAPLAAAATAASMAPEAFHAWASAVSEPRKPIAGLPLDRPNIMAVVNVTPDSFSDGGSYIEPSRAVEAALAMVEAGATLLDIGGESTRPGADAVSLEEELKRVTPVIEGVIASGCKAPISIDTRKAAVARDAFAAGARIFNDVSALGHDPESLAAAAELCAGAPEAGVVLCHSLGDPKTMQDKPEYDDVLLDVYDALGERIEACVAAGVPADRLIVDPGIGFGKTLEHNIALIRGLTLFHGLGSPVLLGASRKRFIGTISGVEAANQRGPGSISAALMGAAKGAQIIRVHDVPETVQALKVWTALTVDG